MPACLSLRRAVATVQFSRAVREGSWPARHHGGRRAGARSLKTQQHARLELGDLPRAPSKSAAPCSSRGTAGQARFGRRARPLGRSHRRGMPAGSRARGAAPAGAFPSGHPVWVLPRKEVIQPHLPVRLPCYDFTPVTSPTFDGSLPCGLGHRLRVLLTPVV